MHARLLLGFAIASILLSVPSFERIPRFLPLLRSEVRAALPEAIHALEARGVWLVNIDLIRIDERVQGTCFRWAHRYTSGRGTDPLEIITTCGKHS